MYQRIYCCKFQGLLPDIPGENNEHNNERFKQETLKCLFRGENMKFGNPFDNFKMNIKEMIQVKMSSSHFHKDKHQFSLKLSSSLFRRLPACHVANVFLFHPIQIEIVL